MKNIVFINAGAGSGKTYKLTEIFTDNISRKICRADQVILTTFTKKAADEFRSRAMEALLSKNLPEEANLLASAAIGTVHSVAYQLIRKYWFRLGIGVDINIMEENDVEFFMNQALANIPTSEQLVRLSQISQQLQFLKDLRVDEGRWKEDLKKILELALSNGISDFTDSKTLSRQIHEDTYTEEELVINQNEIRDVLHEIESHLRGLAYSKTKEAAEKGVRRFLAQPSYDNATIHSVISLLNSLPEATKNLDAVQSLNARLSQVHRLPGVRDMMKDYQDILFAIAQQSLDEFKRYKDGNRLVDYTDMEVKLLELLSIPDIREDIRNSYKQVFVDEFQDSSPIQAEIFIRLSEIADRSWWVGDPKQSIFGFRGTDPMLIKKIADEFLKKDDRNLKIDNLPKSWRSRPEIVDLTNNLFKKALATQVPDPERIALKPVRRGNGFNDKEFPLRHWHHKLPGRFSKAAENASLSESVSELLHSGLRVEDKVRSRYDSDDPALNTETLKSLTHGDLAILRLQNDDISDLAAVLRAKGFEVAASELRFIENAEIQLLMAMLNYLLDKSDTRAKALILAFGSRFSNAAEMLDSRLGYIYSPEAPVKPPIIHGEEGEEGGNDEETENEDLTKFLEYSRDWESDFPVIQKLDALRDSFVLYDLPTLIELIIYNTGLPDIVCRWDNADQRRGNLLTVIRVARQYCDRCINMKLGASVNGFLRYISEIPDKDLSQSASTGRNAINIVTYFKAKGLEWPVVILADLHEDKLIEKNLITREFHGVHLEIQQNINIEAPLQNRKIVLLPSPLSNKAIPEELRRAITESAAYAGIRKKVEDEIKRLLYVGMTRARDYLVTTSASSKKMSWAEHATGIADILESVIAEGTGERDIFQTGRNIALEIKDWGAADTEDHAGTAANRIHRKEAAARESCPRFRNPSSESLPEGLPVNVKVLTDLNKRIDQNLKDREDELGTCLHSIFYHYGKDIDRQSFTAKAGRIISQYGLTEFIPRPEQAYDAISGLFTFLEGTYGPASRIYHELPMQYEEDGYVFRGSADLIWETENELILVDYKSFPGTKKQILDSSNENSAEKHAGQLNAYRVMLEALHPKGKRVKASLIFYPVSGIIVQLS